MDRVVDPAIRRPQVIDDATRRALRQAAIKRGIDRLASLALVVFLVTVLFPAGFRSIGTRKYDSAEGPSNRMNALDPAVAWPEKPFICMDNSFNDFQECHLLKSNGSHPVRGPWADKHQPIFFLNVNMPYASVTRPAPSTLLMYTRLSTTTSECVKGNPMPTRYITVLTTRTKTVTSYRYSSTEASSTALMYGSSESLSTPAASTCGWNELPSLPLASTCGIDANRSGPALSTCSLHERPLYSTVSICGLDEQTLSMLTSTWSLESRRQYPAVSTYALTEQPTPTSTEQVEEVKNGRWCTLNCLRWSSDSYNRTTS